MSEALDNAETEAPDVIGAVDPEAGDAQQQQDDGPNAEDRALTMGWTPKAQFKGDPAKWVDAETFVKRGEEFLPFLKANNKRLESALERATAKIEQMDKGLKSAIQQLSKADQRAYAKARADLEAELEQFAASGNVEGVKAVNKDLVELERETAGKADDGQGPPAELQAFIDDNPWYGKNKGLTAATNAIAQEVYDEGYSGKAQVAEVARRLKAEFPDKFAKAENPNRRQAATVEGAGTAIRPSGKSYSDLPADAKQMCDELIRDMPKLMTREKFVKDYFGQEAKK